MRALYSDKIVTPNSTIKGTIVIDEGCIKEIIQGDKQSLSIPVEDYSDRTIMPGLVDSHVHINEPGRTHWEGFECATKAAAAGGITSMIEMPLNASPVTTTLHAFEQKLDAAHNKLHVHCGFWGGVVPGNTPELKKLKDGGVWGFKAFMVHSGIDEFPAVGEKELKEAMLEIADWNMPLLAHAEIESKLKTSNTKNDHRSYYDYLQSRPPKWETEAIDLLIRLSNEYKCKTHVVHVSSKEGVEQIAKAKEANPYLTAETCPHYLFFNNKDIQDGNTLFKCAPPIREHQHQEALWSALENKTLDFIVTDHSPSPTELKLTDKGDFMKAWGGISSLQWSLPAIWTKAKQKGYGLQDVTTWMCEAPAHFVGLEKKGKIAVGMDADIIVFNPKIEVTPSVDTSFSLHPISPYLGLQLHGKIDRTILKGEDIFVDGNFDVIPKGDILRRNSI